MADDGEYEDPERDDWEWSDELEWHVQRLIAGEVTLEEFSLWYKSETAEPIADPEMKAAAEQMYREWATECLRTNVIKALKNLKPAGGSMKD